MPRGHWQSASTVEMTQKIDLVAGDIKVIMTHGGHIVRQCRSHCF